MKKIVMVICGIAVVCWGVASLQSGALKADNLLQESSVIETTVPESSTVLPVEPESVPKASEPITETPAPAAPASEVPATPETPMEQQPAETAPTDTIQEMPTQSSTVEAPKSDSSTSESSTSSGTSSESSTSQSSTSQTSSTSSSTTAPSESSTSSSSVPSGSTSSTTSSSTGTTSSSSTTPSSSGQEQPQPSTPSTPGPVPSPAPTPPAPNEPKVQTNTDAIQQPPAAFSETSTLQLPSELKTSEVAQSDLKGYELPLLSSFENKAQAALIYDGIKKLGTEQAKDFNVEQLAAKLYSDLFAIEITDTPEQASEEISVGSLLYQKKNDQLELVAQALLESGSGTSSLSLPPNYNLFGVKGTYQGQAVSMATQEDRGNGELYSINSAFRKYPNYAASLGDYVQLLRGGISGNDGYYKDTWRSTAKNYLRSTQALTGKYATDTSYNRKLNSIIAVYNLTQYDRVKVDQSSGIFIKGKDEIPEEYRTMMRYPDYNGVNYNTSGSYPVGQCTWYAFNRVKQLGKSVDDFMGNGGEWGTKGKALGYEVSREPKAGWLISFTPGTAGSDPRYGHVAFVEVVRTEGSLISEGNV